MDFGVKTSELTKINKRIDLVARCMDECSKKVMNSADNLSAIGLGELKNPVDALAERTRKNGVSVRNMNDSLNRIVILYNLTEEKIAVGNIENSIIEPDVIVAADWRIQTPAGWVMSLFIDVDDYEYTYSPGGIFKVPIRPEYLNTDYCLAMANRIIRENGANGMINGMNAERVAAEIFCHALGYYICAVIHDGLTAGEILSASSIKITDPASYVHILEIIGCEKLDELIGPGEGGIMEHAQEAHIDDDGNPYLTYWNIFRFLGF